MDSQKFAPLLARIRENDPTLSRPSFHYQDLSHAQAVDILCALGQNTHVTSIELCGNPNIGEGMRYAISQRVFDIKEQALRSAESSGKPEDDQPPQSAQTKHSERKSADTVTLSAVESTLAGVLGQNNAQAQEVMDQLRANVNQRQ